MSVEFPNIEAIADPEQCQIERSPFQELISTTAATKEGTLKPLEQKRKWSKLSSAEGTQKQRRFIQL